MTKLQYGHLDKALANAGQIVKAGDVIWRDGQERQYIQRARKPITRPHPMREITGGVAQGYDG